MWAWLPVSDELPSVTATLDALTARFGAALETRVSSPPYVSKAAQWEIECTLDRRTFTVWGQKSESTDLLHIQNDHRVLSDDEKAALGASRWSVGVALRFGEDVLDDLHFQFRVLVAIAPNGLAAFDVAAYRLHHFEWVKDAARSSAPPSSDSLFTTHYVSNGPAPGWMHSHGLARCGVLELEAFDIPHDASGSIQHIVNTTASYLLERPLPPPGEPFLIGADLPVLWLPWEEALKRRGPRHGGGREDRDDVHGVPTAVLFAPAKKFLGFLGSGLASLTEHLPVLKGSPIFFISNAQTRRMEQLSRERLPDFRELFARYSKTGRFAFLVKLGYPTENGTYGGREHLWFEVHAIEGEEVDATCINSPRAVPSLREGLRGRHALSLLTDWAIFSPLGRFDAERVGVLVHVLENPPAQLREALKLP